MGQLHYIFFYDIYSEVPWLDVIIDLFITNTKAHDLFELEYGVFGFLIETQVNHSFVRYDLIPEQKMEFLTNLDLRLGVALLPSHKNQPAGMPACEPDHMPIAPDGEPASMICCAV